MLYEWQNFELIFYRNNFNMDMYYGWVSSYTPVTQPMVILDNIRLDSSMLYLTVGLVIEGGGMFQIVF